jgi:hypothetical protein
MLEVNLDSNNPLDQEIQQHIMKELRYRNRARKYYTEEKINRFILHKKLAQSKYNTSFSEKNRERIEQKIEIGIRNRISRTGMSRDNVIREAFCKYFNIPFCAVEQ